MNWRDFMKAPWLRLAAAEVPLDPSRRAFIAGAAAVVAAASIMPVHIPLVTATELPVAVWLDGRLISSAEFYEDLAAVTREAFVPRLFVGVYKQSPALNLLHQLQRERNDAALDQLFAHTRFYGTR
jgi:hypothetical protein